jgi:DNA mismatch repair protein MutL
MKTQSTEARPRIAVLPDAIVDQIAAGEVVERPASVVKELVENALDAFATEIDVAIRHGGMEEIRVTDNGVGMDREAALLALKRHATSKIRSMDDLAGVSTLGFRGEALPSIASVSRLELLARALDADTGTRIRVAGGRVTDVAGAGGPVGTTVTVRDLFYNVPARRKFLKTAATESRRVAAWMTDLALGSPRVAFRYRSEERLVFNLSTHDETVSRIGELLGVSVARALLPIDNQLDYVGVRGFIGRPDIAKTHRTRTFIYVNGRRIQDRALVHALTTGYGEYLPEGRFPVAVLFLTLPADTLDVNVHPTKAEVRFLHPRLVHDALYYAVNRVLLSHRIVPTLDTRDDASEPALDRSAGPGEPQPRYQAQGWRSGKRAEARGTQDWRALYQPAGTPDVEERDISAGETDPEAELQQLRGLVSRSVSGGPDVTAGRFFQLGQLYIVTPLADALIVMDQHAAHERILYEAVVDRINAELTVAQNLLFPLSVELDPATFELFEHNADLFGRTGFAVRPFGHRTVLLEGAPAVLKGKAPDRHFREVLEMLASELRGGRDRLSAIAASFACKAAVRAGDELSREEMAALFDQLFATRRPYSCPHGRPTIIRIPRVELDRKFGRT